MKTREEDQGVEVGDVRVGRVDEGGACDGGEDADTDAGSAVKYGLTVSPAFGAKLEDSAIDCSLETSESNTTVPGSSFLIPMRSRHC